MIIGSSGAGKSTAARMIGEKLGLPIFHMDREVYWLPGWVERDKADQVRQVERIAAQEHWVIDGNNSSTFPIRETRADLLIRLDLPLPLRLFRVIRRTLQQRGQSRPDMADGCVEKLHMLPGFLHFIITTGRKNRRKQAAFFANTTLPKHRFARPADLHRFVAALL